MGTAAYMDDGQGKDSREDYVAGTLLRVGQTLAHGCDRFIEVIHGGHRQTVCRCAAVLDLRLGLTLHRQVQRQHRAAVHGRLEHIGRHDQVLVVRIIAETEGQGAEDLEV